MIKSKVTVGMLIIMLTTVWLLAGCGTPQKKPGPVQPPVPQTQNTQGLEPDILVYMHETGDKRTMKMEEYIAGVVAGEMKNDWPIEALAAQAIMARTFTLEALETKGGVPARGAQASTDIKEFQAYDAKAVNEAVTKAVEMTRGQVITYQGRLAKTWFHASAGGMTASAVEGLHYQEAEPPYIKPVESPDDLAPADVRNWSARFGTADVLAAMAKQGIKADKIESFTIQEKGPSQRAMRFVVNGNTAVSAPEFRIAVGSTKLKSTLLDSVTLEGDEVVFSGRGYGHGVGLSQWGSHKLAKDGKTPAEIIAHYYQNVTVEKRWQ